MIKKIKIKKFLNSSGLLIPIEFKKINDKRLKRVFFLEIKKGFERGNHAHKKCTQIIILLTGSVKIEISNKIKKIILNLTEKSKFALVIKPRTWIKIIGLSKKNILAVLCDEKYSKNDYINNFKLL